MPRKPIHAKPRARHVDYPLFFLTLALVGIGIFIIFSSSVVISQKNFGHPYYYLLRHVIAAVVGVGVMFALQAISYRFWKRFSLAFLIFSLMLVAAVFIPEIGFQHGGASRWIDIGPLTVQPSEILKLSLILYLAGWLDRRRGRSEELTSTFVPFLVIMTVVGVLLLLQPDIGTLLVIIGSAVILYFLGGGKISQIASLGLLAIIALVVIVQVAPYRVNRFRAFFDPAIDPQGISYHIYQAEIAIGSGGFWGRGFGQSIQKFNYLPEPIGDSVFAVVVEEFGFVGGAVLSSLFFFLFLRCIMIAREAPDFFGKLLAAGFGSAIVLQAFINMAAISRLLPLTGVPLPFISYGGTSLVATLAMIGIILSISKRTV